MLQRLSLAAQKVRTFFGCKKFDEHHEVIAGEAGLLVARQLSLTQVLRLVFAGLAPAQRRPSASPTITRSSTSVGTSSCTESDVWTLSRGHTGGYVHPTQKPVELFERAIRNSSRAGDIVLDVFGGSGSTLIACERTGRAARLVELDPKFCDAIASRWTAFFGRAARRIA